MNDKMYTSTPVRSVVAEETGPSDKKLAYYGAVVALCIIAAKLYFQNAEDLKNLLMETKLISYERIVTDGDVMLTYAWKSSIRYSQYWLPILCGGVITYFTWLMVYLDSKDPGRVPPSPFSPSRDKSYVPVFHLNYLFGLIVGVLVASYLYYKGISLEF